MHFVIVLNKRTWWWWWWESAGPCSVQYPHFPLNYHLASCQNWRYLGYL